MKLADQGQNMCSEWLDHELIYNLWYDLTASDKC